MSRIPITLVTGFLGSGKTTLIARVLREPWLAGTLVIVNEFGEVGIDHDLIEASSDDTILLANGCLCCTIRGNLVDTLLDARGQVAEGRLRAFDRVIVETSGVADPAPLLGFLLGTEPVMRHYRLETVITTCDCVTGTETLASHPEAANQARVADRLIVTKSDLVPAEALAQFTALLRRLNPTAQIWPVVQGEIDASTLLRSDTETETRAAPPLDVVEAQDHAARFTATVLTATRPVSTTELAEIDKCVRRYAGPHLLRLKGILPLQGGGRHAVLQAAMIIVHRPEIRAGMPPGLGRLVLITDSAKPDMLISALAPFGLAVFNQPVAHATGAPRASSCHGPE